MKSSFDLVLLFALFFVILNSNVECDQDHRLNGTPNDKKLRLLNFLKVDNPLRSKRSLKDVEKMMLEDEIMAMLICEMCERHACMPQYCGFCLECELSNDISNDKDIKI